MGCCGCKHARMRRRSEPTAEIVSQRILWRSWCGYQSRGHPFIYMHQTHRFQPWRKRHSQISWWGRLELSIYTCRCGSDLSALPSYIVRWKNRCKENRIYLRRFLKMLHKKILAKKPHFQDQFNDDDYSSISNFKQFDDRYTAPLHGFSSAEDYWEKASSLQFLPAIKLPTLILSARWSSSYSAMLS